MKNFKKLALASVLCTGVCLTVGARLFHLSLDKGT